MSIQVTFSNPSCVSCGKKIGGLTEEESHAFFADFETMLCFDCDPASALSVPSFFWQWKEEELFDIGDVGFQIRNQTLNVIGRSHARSHEYERAPGLSSYTNLNRNSKKWGFLEDLYTWEVCPDCHGRGHDFQGSTVPFCSSCADLGSIKVLDKWIAQLLGLGVSNA